MELIPRTGEHSPWNRPLFPFEVFRESDFGLLVTLFRLPAAYELEAWVTAPLLE